VSFAADGRGRFRAEDDEVDGDVEARIAPPARAWLQVRSRALFGMVGERLVVSLPGDGYVLVYEERADRLTRVSFDSSLAALLAVGGGPPALLALARGRIPSHLGGEAELQERVRVSPEPRSWQTFTLVPPRESRLAGDFCVEVEQGRMRRFAWLVGGDVRLEVRYEAYRSMGGVFVPSRIRVRAPGARLEGQLELEHLEPRQGFEASDFDVGWRSGRRCPGTPKGYEV
jgi:hypothetical protein